MNDEVQAGFVAKLRTFAEKHAFAIRIAQSTPDELDALVQLWREDVKAIGRSLPSSRAGERIFKISFYSNDVDIVPDTVVDRMMGDLELAAKETDGAQYQAK